MEVAVAFALISILMLTSNGLMQLALKTNRKALERSKATVAIQQQIEYLRSLRDFADGVQEQPADTFDSDWLEFCSNTLTELEGEGGSIDAFHLRRDDDDYADGSPRPDTDGDGLPNSDINQVDIEPGARQLYTELGDNEDGIYTGVLEGSFHRSNGNEINNPDPDDCENAAWFDVIATVTWPSFGNGPTEVSTMPFRIANNAWLNDEE